MQLMVLPAALALDPAVALRDATFVAGYVSVHWSPAGSLPAGEVSVRFSGIVPPGALLPDANAIVSCANAAGATARRTATATPRVNVPPIFRSRT